MQNFTVDERFWELFPEAEINILVLNNIQNRANGDERKYEQLLADAQVKAKEYLNEEVFSQNPVVAQWREAYTKFKTKKGARSSIEALMKRIDQGKPLGSINPLVDIYNSISLEYALPAGGENIQKIDGDLHLGIAQGGEGFLPLGAEVDEPALPGEVIYYDQTGAVCRCFNWREAQRTMLTDDTTDAVLVIEALNPEQKARAQKAILRLKELVDQEFAIDSTAHVINASQPSATL